MRIQIEGESYDTEQMLAYETGLAGIPTLYVTPDHRCVLVLQIDRLTGVGVHRASDSEIRHWAEQLKAKELLNALQQDCQPQS